MRTILMGAGAALAMMATACGDREPVPENEVGRTAEVPGPEAYQQELQGMAEGARNAVFVRALIDAGRECQHVQSSSFVGEEQGFPVWQAQCADGQTYKIMIQNDGVASVIDTAPGAELQLGEGGNALAPAGNAQQGQ